MKNIEIKQIINGELAVVMEGFYSDNLPFGSTNMHLNLENMLYFQIYKLDEGYEDFSITRKLINNDDKSTFVDGISENSDFLEVYNTHNNFWRVKIPKNTPAINLYFPNEIVFYLYFLHHGEYQKFKRILTEKNS